MTKYFICFLLLFNAQLKGQEDSIKLKELIPKNTLFFQPQIHFGKLLKIYPNFPSSNISAIYELNIAQQTNGKKEWHQSYHYPQVGISICYTNFGNNDVLGNSVSISPNLSFNRCVTQKLKLQTRFGMGFSYFTKHFNRFENTSNLVIGSTLTNITFLCLDLNYQISSNITCNIGISSYHYSNAHYQLPNVGANIPCANIGMSYSPQAKPNFYKRQILTSPNKNILVTSAFGYGRHEFGSATGPTGGPKYSVYQTLLYITKRYKQIHNFQAGIAITYYTDYYDFIVSEEMFEKQQHLKSNIITLFTGDEFIIGRIGLVAQIGINIYNPFLREFSKWKKYDTKALLDTYNSNKVGIQYYFFNPQISTHKNIFIGIYMKTKGAAADFPQITCGYTF